MALTSTAKIRAAGRGDFTAPSQERKAGISLAVVGLVLATVAFFANLNAFVAISDGGESSVLPWSFGLTTLGFGTIKVGIAIILIGILVRLYMRWEAMATTLPQLVTVDHSQPVKTGDYQSARGPATATAVPPKQLPIHTMAQRMWAPMLAMGAMAVAVGFLTSLAWANGNDATRAWTQGLQFLGEALLLSGISFLLASILAGIRNGGSAVQAQLGVAVKTLKMPKSAKAFVALMTTGLMLGVVQFIVYLTLLGADAAAFAQTNAWLGPLRELSIGLLLAGIVLALATIGTALGFQADRVTELIKTGR